MKVAIRPFASTDLEDVVKLRTFMYADRPEAWDTAWQSSIWQWLGTHPLADEMHRWVLDAEGEVVGHLAALPQFYWVNGHRVVAHTPADYAVLPQYGFHALSLMRAFFHTCENCIACDTAPAVISVQTRLGAEEVGKLQFAAKLWNVSGVPSFPASIPVPVPQLLNVGLRALDGALSGSLFVDETVDNLRVEVLEQFDSSFDELFDSIAAVVPCVPEKDAAFLRWRYGPSSPQSPVTVIGVRNEQTLLGYAVLWMSEGDDGYLLDLIARPGRHDVARSLLREAVRHFAWARVRSIRYKYLQSPTSPRVRDAWRLGFFLSKKRRSTLQVKFADQGLHKTARNPANWSYSFGDGEITFWVR